MSHLHPRETIFLNDRKLKEGTVILAAWRKPRKPFNRERDFYMASLACVNPRGEKLFTAPTLTDRGIDYIVRACRDAGWTPSYIINVRPKKPR